MSWGGRLPLGRSYTKTLDAVVWVAAVLAYGVRWTISRRMARQTTRYVHRLVSAGSETVRDQGKGRRANRIAFTEQGFLGFTLQFNTEEAFLGVK